MDNKYVVIDYSYPIFWGLKQNIRLYLLNVYEFNCGFIASKKQKKSLKLNAHSVNLQNQTSFFHQKCRIIRLINISLNTNNGFNNTVQYLEQLTKLGDKKLLLLQLLSIEL